MQEVTHSADGETVVEVAEPPRENQSDRHMRKRGGFACPPPEDHDSDDHRDNREGDEYQSTALAEAKDGATIEDKVKI
jgi:hypothetical protein